MLNSLIDSWNKNLMIITFVKVCEMQKDESITFPVLQENIIWLGCSGVFTFSLSGNS